MNKLLLTGRPRSGKSSLLQKYLTGFTLSGFAIQRLTRAEETWAFRLLDLAEEPYVTHLESEADWDDIAISLQTSGRWRGNTSVFEDKGRRALEKCFKSKGLVILDELGIFEGDALNFQWAVLEVLDSEMPVLGVLKDKSTPFLDRIRHHSEVKIAWFPSQEAVSLVEELTGRLRRQQ